MFFEQYGSLLWEGTLDTLYMTGISTVLSYGVGLPLGIFLYITDNDAISQNRFFNAIIGWIVNVIRSIPFLILIVFLIPFTQIVMGKAIGSTAAILPLVIGAGPFVARMVESSLKEIDYGLIDCAKAMGATHYQIITRVLLPETLPSLVRGLSISTITIMSYTAMAGVIGGGGLGDIAIRYGYHRFNNSVMIATMVILVILVQIIQVAFDVWAKRIDKNV